MDPRKLHTF